MNSYDNVAKSIESAIDIELQTMQDEMNKIQADETDMMNIEDSDEIKEGAKQAAIDAMHQYLLDQGLRMTGPWKATADQRVQRHIQ